MQISRELGELNALSYYNVAESYGKLGQFKMEDNLLDTALTFIAAERNWALGKKIWQAKAQNLALQKQFAPAYAAMDSVVLYMEKEVDSSIIVQAKELETQYGLLEKDNQIKSLALANQAGEKMRERQQKAIVRISSGVVILGFLLVWFWRRKHYKRLIREASLRQQLLRGQIESHFLYSSVSGLKQVIRKGDREGAIEFVEQLGRLYRLSLENARQPFVPLNNELHALTSYLKLQQTLFCNGFDYRIDVEPAGENILIPPMLLQPFAENAILHGFAGQKEKGLINISIKKNHKALYCIIEDNGRGFQGAETNNHKRPLSTVINQERLEILSRQTKTIAKLTIVDKKATVGESGVRVELIVPYRADV
jgi:LytS/YehU family sensor histidine kinase